MYSRVFDTKKISWFIIICIVVVFGCFVFSKSDEVEGPQLEEPSLVSDYKNATFMIDGKSVQLVDGYSESEIVSGSAAKVITRYFGSELFTDIDNDGDDDIAFILTQETGGSGTFYYVVAALKTEKGYVGSDGYLLGDRIAPQSANVSHNPRHKNVLVFNYAERAQGESMSVQPSMGKSAYLKLDLETMRWGIVEPDFEGESRDFLR